MPQHAFPSSRSAYEDKHEMPKEQPPIATIADVRSERPRPDERLDSAAFVALSVGLLMLIRHKASLGGLGVLAIHLQNTRGWRAGKTQMAADVLILAVGVLVRDPLSVALSVVGAVALNLVIAVNHKSGRYIGT